MKSITYSLSLIICIGIVACSSPKKTQKKILDSIEKQVIKFLKNQKKLSIFCKAKKKKLKKKLKNK